MSETQVVNCLVVATVAQEQAGELTQRLVAEGFHFTQASAPALLDAIPISLWIGLERAGLPRLLNLLHEVCRTRRRFIPAQFEGPWREGLGTMIEADIGGAVAYVLEVERFEQV